MSTTEQAVHAADILAILDEDHADAADRVITAADHRLI